MSPSLLGLESFADVVTKHLGALLEDPATLAPTITKALVLGIIWSLATSQSTRRVLLQRHTSLAIGSLSSTLPSLLDVKTQRTALMSCDLLAVLAHATGALATMSTEAPVAQLDAALLDSLVRVYMRLVQAPSQRLDLDSHSTQSMPTRCSISSDTLARNIRYGVCPQLGSFRAYGSHQALTSLLREQVRPLLDLH